MRFTPVLVAILASAASASPIAASGPAAATENNHLERRTGGNGLTCMLFCWEWCILPTACGTCLTGCMAVANPLTEFDPSKVPGLGAPGGH